MEIPHLSAKSIREMGKRNAAAEIFTEIANTGFSAALDVIVDDLLDSDKLIDDTDNIEWCRWLIAGGRTPAEFISHVRSYDNHAKCGLVWIPHVVAYRCRTCGISPCMSICRDCFKRGNHKNHDFNMFLSQAGGACDCGDTSVMKAEGFCSDHGINNRVNKEPPPPNLLIVAEAMMPRLLLRLLLHFRIRNSISSNSTDFGKAAKDCDEYCSLLMDLNNMGELMRNVMTKTLINEEVYDKFCNGPFPNTRFGTLLARSKLRYEEALNYFPSPEAPGDYANIPALGETVRHKTLLEEFIFWTFRFEFPQNIVCFLLNMLPDQDYKEHLTRTFVMHYSRIPTVLERSSDTETLSNRVVHMSVQLFSNEALALKMVEELSLLHVMIISLKLMMSKILTRHTLHDPEKNFHFVIDCAKQVMKEHCYWPLVSDFNNVLSHESVALLFLRDDKLIDMWFQFLSMLQGMNVNVRETGSHVEFEPSSYYAAFSCELEASAYPMWSIISHLKNPVHAPLAKKLISFCVNYLQDWLDAVNFYSPKIEKGEMMHASFHFPLHRYLAAFLSQSVKTMGIDLNDVLPSAELLSLLMTHPMRVQSLFYEILAGIWVRNGLQIKGQAMTYIQANFCNSMVDMDMFFLQICATQLPANQFISSAIDLFGVSDWLGMGPMTTPQEMEQDLMLEGLLTFLSMVVSSRTNLGNEEHEQCIIEIAALLATGDKTHSQLLELLPERSGNAHTRNFEKFLKQLSTYRSPPQGSENLEQGLFIPVPDVWEHHYDPLHVLQRAVHRRDFQSSMDRFTQYVKQIKRMPKSGNVWPPFRLPKPIRKPYNDSAAILTSKIMHAMLLGIFYRAVNSHNISENLLALAIFLLEVAVDYSNDAISNSSALETAAPSTSFYNNRDIPELLNCFPNNNLKENLRHMVSKISLNPPEPQVSPANYNNNTPFDSDIEWDMSETDPLPMLVGSLDTDYSNQALALPQDLSVVRDTTVAVPNRDESMDDDDMSPTVQTNLLPLTLQPYPALTEFREPAQAGTTGMEVVIMRRELPNTETNRVTPEMFSSSSSNSSGVMLPFNRVQPVVPSRNTEMLQAGPATTRRLNSSKRRNTEGSIGTPNSDADSLNIDESILSLLLKLHSQLSGTLDSFSLEDEDNDEDSSMDEASTSNSRTALGSRIGDGPFFIGNLLHKIARTDESCARAINEIRQKLWPNQRERQAEQKAREAREKEERSKRAKERQQRLMQEFANKQKQFMAQAMENEIDIDMEEDYEIETPREKEYDCIICNTTSPSTESNPIGLVVLVESSSLVGHRRKTDEQLPLPVCDGDRMNPDRDVRLSKEFNRRVELLSSKFGSNSWYLSHNIGWEGGVHVQSCGHHVHLTCQDAYLKSLYTSQRPTNLNVERGEFFCPVCRQLANSVLPLSPQLDRLTPMVRVPVPPFSTLVTELMHLMKENKRPSTTTKFYEAMGRAMGCMTNSTQRNIKRHEPTAQTIFSFVVSIARTNLENEIIQRGGSLSSVNNIRYKPKRDCIVPLLHVLSLHVRIMINDDRPSRLTNEDWPVRLTNDEWPLHLSSDDWPVWNLWASLCGISFHDSNTLVPSSHTIELIPILLSDPSALMLKFILLAPLQLDQVYFTCIVKTMYNVLFYQIITQLCATLTELECNKLLSAFGGYEESGVRHIGHAMALVLANLDKCGHIRKESVDEASAARNSDINPIDLKPYELEVQKLCLPFLRIAALLRHHIYHQELPHVAATHLEFARLVYFLELVTVSMDWNKFDSTKALCFIPSMDITLPKRWCAELKEVSPPHHITRDLVIHQHLNWQQPRLLRLPREYEKLFTYYHEQICPKCGTVPKESSICLLCGTIVCLKQLCCKEENCCEAVRHSITCGGGTGIFLVVTSTYIIIVRGRRACLWGSLYLDDYDEEDRDLKRGKPLYLSEDRFNLLESQWLSHRFAHTKHTWVWHRESL